MAHSSYLDGGQVATSHLARATVLQRSAVAAVGRPPVAFLPFPAISVYDTSEAIFRRSQLSMSSPPLPSLCGGLRSFPHKCFSLSSKDRSWTWTREL